MRKYILVKSDINKSMKLDFNYRIFVILAFLSISMINSGQIPTNGLVAFYPFNGNANDESGNGNHRIADTQVGYISNSEEPMRNLPLSTLIIQ